MMLGIIFSFDTFANDGIAFHTDNGQDQYSFEHHLPLSLSSESNMAVLNTVLSQVKLDVVPLKRSLKFMDDNENVCVINKIKTEERVKKYLFSEPINLFFNRRLYQANGVTPLNGHAVDLEVLFEKYPNRRLLITTQMSYGDKLDKIIAKIPKRNLVTRNSGLQGSGVLEMFHQNRADYAIIHPQEIHTDDVMDKPMQSYEILGINPYIVGHLMCSDTPQSHLYIKKLNKRIAASVADGTLYEIHAKYVNSAQSAYFERYFKAVFKAP